jgi:hypothetical protein
MGTNIEGTRAWDCQEQLDILVKSGFAEVDEVQTRQWNASGMDRTCYQWTAKAQGIFGHYTNLTPFGWGEGERDTSRQATSWAWTEGGVGMNCTKCGLPLDQHVYYVHVTYELRRHNETFGFTSGVSLADEFYHEGCAPGHILRAAKGITEITGAARLGVQEVK